METDFKVGAHRRKADCCLDVLRVGPATTEQLIGTVGHRFSTYIDQLRKRGYEIETVDLKDGTGNWSHRITGYPPVERVRVTPEMQSAYYDGDHWRAVRRDRLEFDNNRCCHCHCPVPPLQVHHWRYDLFAEKRADLMTLCEPCHQDIHATENVNVHFPRFVDAEIAERLQALAGITGVTRQAERPEPARWPRNTLFDESDVMVRPPR